MKTLRFEMKTLRFEMKTLRFEMKTLRFEMQGVSSALIHLIVFHCSCLRG